DAVLSISELDHIAIYLEKHAVVTDILLDYDYNAGRLLWLVGSRLWAALQRCFIPDGRVLINLPTTPRSGDCLITLIMAMSGPERCVHLIRSRPGKTCEQLTIGIMASHWKSITIDYEGFPSDPVLTAVEVLPRCVSSSLTLSAGVTLSADQVGEAIEMACERAYEEERFEEFIICCDYLRESFI
ncbi:hypothetical protein PFISCL1PPCAC_7313, partial [Pristionchus fissidentatus]